MCSSIFSGLHMCNSIFLGVYTWLHMANGYTCVTPFFWSLHMATHGYTSTTHLRNFPRSPVVWPDVLPLSGGWGLNVRHLIQIRPSNWPFKHKTSQDFLLSTGFLYDYMLKMWMDMKKNDVHFLAPGMPFVVSFVVFKIHSQWYRYLCRLLCGPMGRRRMQKAGHAF